MSVGMGAFKRGVSKIQSVKTAKLGLKITSKSTTRASLAQAAVKVNTDMGAVIQRLNPYILGLAMTHEIKEEAQIAMGDLGASITVLCRILKVKMPSSTKKIKLVGTRTAAILSLYSVSNEILRITEESLFSEPKMTTIKKMVVNPSAVKTSGSVEKKEKEVQVLDIEAEEKAEAEREQSLKKLTIQAVELYWSLCYDMFGYPPAHVLEVKLKRMMQDNPSLVVMPAKKEEEQKVHAATA